jgi:hypothetical protein
MVWTNRRFALLIGVVVDNFGFAVDNFTDWVFSLEGGGYTDPSVNGVMQKKHNLFWVFLTW